MDDFLKAEGTLRRRCGVFAAAFMMAAPVSAGEAVAEGGKQAVPKELFGITVGQTYDVGSPDEGNLGNFPVRKFAGMHKFLGAGVSYYFQPLKANPMFEYSEERKNPDDKYFTTTFRAYLYPVIPSSIQTLDNLKAAWPELKQIVSMIEWQKKLPKDDEAYYRAIDLCATFSAGVDVEPKIVDIDRWYTCTFTSGDRELEVRNTGELLSLSLSLRSDIREKLDKDVDTKIRGLQAKELLQ